MPEQRLHHAQIGAIMQEVTGESVAQHMGTDLLGAQSCRSREALQFARQMLACQMPGFTE